MAKIIVYGDIGIFSVCLTVDNGQGVTVRGEFPQQIDISPGSHYIEATTMNKLERSIIKATGISQPINIYNSTISGQFEFKEDDVLLVKLELTLIKTELTAKLISMSQIGEYVDLSTMLRMGEVSVIDSILCAMLIFGKPYAPIRENKWLLLFVCAIFGGYGVHRFIEGRYLTGVLGLAAFTAFIFCLSAKLIGAVFIVSLLMVMYIWPIDFIRILCRKE